MNNLKLKTQQHSIDGKTALVTPAGVLYTLESLLVEDCSSLEVLGINQHGRIKKTVVRNFEILDFVNSVTEIVTTSGQTVALSENHQIILPNNEIIEVENLQPGDVVTAAQLNLKKPGNVSLNLDYVLEVNQIKFSEPKPLYGFTMDDMAVGYFAGQVMPDGISLLGLPKF